MNRRLVLIVYNLLLPLALLFALPGYVVKMLKRGNYGRGFGERFGRYRPEKRAALAALDRPLWIHAVSVGEVNIAKKLIAALRAAEPELPIVLSSTTPTGHAIAEQSEASAAIYHPFDFRPGAAAALKAVDPRALVLIEAEVWPNLVSLARRRGIEISLVNARLSPRSESRYRTFKALTAPLFGQLTRVCVQEPEDVARWESLGLPVSKIQHCGSIKFDPAGAAKPQGRGEFHDLLERHLGGREANVLLAGSTHAGEEALIGKVYLRLREHFPDLHYLVAPRHVERREEVLAELRAVGLRPALRSQIGDGENVAPEEAPDCLVIDTTGELGAWYHESDLVVIGKSFLAEGGQNPVEAIFAGKPVFYGPHMENFKALIALLARVEGAVQVADPESLGDALTEHLKQPERAETMAARAAESLATHEGAAERTAAAVLGSK